MGCSNWDVVVEGVVVEGMTMLGAVVELVCLQDLPLKVSGRYLTFGRVISVPRPNG